MIRAITKEERPPISDDTPFLNRNSTMLLVQKYMDEYDINIIEALAYLLEESTVLDEKYQFDEHDIADILTKDEIDEIRLIATYEMGHLLSETSNEVEYDENILEDGDFWI